MAQAGGTCSLRADMATLVTALGLLDLLSSWRPRSSNPYVTSGCARCCSRMESPMPCMPADMLPAPYKMLDSPPALYPPRGPLVAEAEPGAPASPRMLDRPGVAGNRGARRG